MARTRRALLTWQGGVISLQYGERRSGEEHRRSRQQGSYGARSRGKRLRGHWDTRGGRARELDYDDDERARRVIDGGKRAR
jgi:hypothetical protein